MATFDFCPDTQVPEMLPREQASVVTMNGWTFTSKPTTPFVKSYKLTLHGLYWFLDANEEFDHTTDAEHNARALELFYEEHELWKPFDWTHPHTGVEEPYRFKIPVTVPKAIPNSNGLIEPLEIQLIQHNPGY